MRCVTCEEIHLTQCEENFAAKKISNIKEKDQEDYQTILGLSARVRSEIDLDDDELDDNDNMGVIKYVEDEKIKCKLASMGVDYGQGFHIGKPALFSKIQIDLAKSA